MTYLEPSGVRIQGGILLDRRTPTESPALSFANALLGGMAAAQVATAASVQAGERDAYINLLRSHDWTHEFSDDGRAYTKGREQLARLRELQPVVDADGVLWRAHAPQQHGVAQS